MSSESLQQQGWSPNDNNSPFYVWDMLTNEEWLRISRQYPFSIRVLVQLEQKKAVWHEQARTATQDQAKELMHALTQQKSKKRWLVGWVVIEYEARDSNIWEKPVLWYPTQDQMLTTMRQVGLLKSTKEHV